MTYYTEVSADSPVYHYKLGEASGNALDSGSQGRALTVAAGVTRGATGIPGNTGNNAVTLNGGTTSYLSDTGHVVSYASDDVFTVECWFKTSDADSTLVMWFVSPYWYFNIDAAGKLSFVAGSVSMVSPGTVNNNQWHHAVAVINGTSHKLYLDGTQVQTATGDPGTLSTNGQFYIGDNRSAYSLTGVVDEVAIYNSALSATRVTAHYQAGMGFNSVTVDVTTATATTQTQDVTVEGNVSLNAITTDTWVFNGNAISRGSDTVLTIGAGSDRRGLFAVPTPTIPSGQGFASAKLRLYVIDGGDATQATVWRNTAAWSGANLTAPAATSVKTVSISPTAGQWLEIDVTEVVAAWLTGTTNNGIAISTNASAFTELDVSSIEGSNDPILKVTSTPAVSTTFDADTPTVSSAAQDVSLSTGLSFDASTVTASAVANDVTVEVIVSPDVTLDVATANVTTTAPEPSAGGGTVVDAGTTDTVMAGAYDVTVEVTAAEIIEVQTVTASAEAIRLTDVNGEPIVPTEEEDPYFVSTMNTLDGNDYWFRLNETSGNHFDNRAATSESIYDLGLTNVGAAMGQHEGPENRHSVYFNGAAYLRQQEPSGTNVDEPVRGLNSLEFTFRTEKENQFILAASDNYAVDTSTAIVTGNMPAVELYLVNGRVEARQYKLQDYSLTPRIERSLTGFTNLADGEWHHVVIQRSPTVNMFNPNSLEIYVDGKLEIRRREGFNFGGMPDYIGGRPNTYDPYPDLSPADWFVGDLTEVVFRNQRVLALDEVLVQRDNIFGIKPVYVSAAKATARSHDATAKGNKKRVLVLDFGRNRDSKVSTRSSISPFEQYGGTLNAAENAGQTLTYEFSGLGKTVGGSAINSTDVGGYQVFYALVIEAGFYDEVTDNPRLLDLDKDLNMDDYDIISIVDYPQSENQWVAYDVQDQASVGEYIPARQQLEHLVEQVKDQVVDGKGLFIADPASAIAFDIVDRVEWVPNLKEAVYNDRRIGAFTGIYDWYAAQIDPFMAASPDRYEDMHANTRQRVRALVPGLTDIPSWVVTDALVWQNIDPMAPDVYHETYKQADRTTGLNLGDEFYMAGAGVTFQDWVMANGPGWGDMRGGWKFGYFATPLDHITSGKAVTTFANGLWMQDDFVENPFKDYASTIVVEPGDTLGGRQIEGKVFVNFTEQASHWAQQIEYMQVQVVPPNSELDPRDWETPEQREWTYTTHRGDWTGTTIGGSGGTTTVSVGSAGEVVLNSQKPNDSLVSQTWRGQYPTFGIPVLTMFNRGFIWLGTEQDADGNATVGVESANVTVKAEETTVSAAKSVEVELSTARAQAETYPEADTAITDTSVLVITPTVVAQAGAHREVVDLTTATVNAQAHENMDWLFEFSEVISLTMPIHALTLYMEDA